MRRLVVLSLLLSACRPADHDRDGFTAAQGDCDDDSAAIGPEASDVAGDGIDQNCDGVDGQDVDQDGYASAASGGPDCDDADPAISPDAAEVTYDGIDQDCDGADLDDLDGDGYAAGPDCDDGDAAIHPGAADAWYDGVDSNCLGDDDFDADEDGFIPDTYAAIYPGSLREGDCDDADPTVHPGQMEIVGDEDDQDCDGGLDTTRFTYGALAWKQPRRPALAANDLHYLLTTVADEFVDDSARQQVGLTLPFAKTSGFAALPEEAVVWLGGGGSDPLGWGVDMMASGKDFYAASSYRGQVAGAWNQYLTLRKIPWSPVTSSYGDSLLAYHRVVNDDVYEDVDLRQAADGTLWLLGCGPATVHFLTVTDSGTALEEEARKAQISADGGTGGAACHLQFAGAKTYALVGNATKGTLGYSLVAGTEDIAPATTYDDPAFDFWSAVDRGTWQVYAGGDGGFEGVTLDDGTKSYEALTKDTTKSGKDYTAVHADVATYGGVVYLLAIVEGATKPEDYEIVFAYGDPATGKLTDTVVKFTGAATPQIPLYAGIYADKDRVMMAVSGKAVTGTQDAVGWAFLGPKK